jgi:hypothetical protein
VHYDMGRGQVACQQENFEVKTKGVTSCIVGSLSLRKENKS